MRIGASFDIAYLMRTCASQLKFVDGVLQFIFSSIGRQGEGRSQNGNINLSNIRTWT